MKWKHVVLVEILWSSWIHLTHLSSGGLVHFASGGDGEMGWVFPAEVFPSLPHSTQQSSVSKMFSFSWIFFYEFMFGAWDERVVSTAGLVPQHLVLESLQETKHDLCCGWAQNRNRVAPVMFDVFWCCLCIEWSEVLVFDIVQDLFWSLFQMWFCDVSCAFPLRLDGGSIGWGPGTRNSALTISMWKRILRLLDLEHFHSWVQDNTK